MKLLALFLLVFLTSCATRSPKVVKEKPEAPVYLSPLKGSLEVIGRGVFIRSRCGDFVRAVAEGRVVYSGKDVDNFGWVVMVEQKDGFLSVYGKINNPWVRSGERVKRRQVIGKAGRWKDACGVYYELRDKEGKPLKPVLR